MRVDEWFIAWAEWLTGLIPRGDWPEADSPFWAEVKRSLIATGATREIARDAGRLLFEDPPDFVSDFPKSLKAKIGQAFRAKNAREHPAPVPAIDPRGESFDRAAYATWSTLSDEEREVWRALVSERFPFFTGRLSELMAISWAHDPSAVIPLPPPRTDPAPLRRGPRKLFEPIEKV